MISTTNRTFYIWNAIVTTLALSFLIWLIFLRPNGGAPNLAASQLPTLNASLNATCALILLLGYWAIKTGRELLHKNLMIAAFVVSTAFLVSYVYYHSLQGDTKFLGEGIVRPVYFTILISHILLSMIVFPMILSTIYFGLADKRKTHRRIARITFPIWLYVSITGVVIFFMLRHYS